jgi:hypothetical protein
LLHHADILSQVAVEIGNLGEVHLLPILTEGDVADDSAGAAVAYLDARGTGVPTLAGDSDLSPTSFGAHRKLSRAIRDQAPC